MVHCLTTSNLQESTRLAAMSPRFPVKLAVLRLQQSSANEVRIKDLVKGAGYAPAGSWWWSVNDPALIITVLSPHASACDCELNVCELYVS